MATATATKPPAMGPLIDKMWAEREAIRKLEAEVAERKKVLDELEVKLMDAMGANGLDKATGRAASVSLTKTVVADVQGDEGWKAFHAYIKKTGYFHLLQRRVSDAAYRELLEQGKKVPGVQPFNKVRLNLRTLSS